MSFASSHLYATHNSKGVLIVYQFAAWCPACLRSRSSDVFVFTASRGAFVVYHTSADAADPMKICTGAQDALSPLRWVEMLLHTECIGKDEHALLYNATKRAMHAHWALETRKQKAHAFLARPAAPQPQPPALPPPQAKQSDIKKGF